MSLKDLLECVEGYDQRIIDYILIKYGNIDLGNIVSLDVVEYHNMFRISTNNIEVVIHKIVDFPMFIINLNKLLPLMVKLEYLKLSSEYFVFAYPDEEMFLNLTNAPDSLKEIEVTTFMEFNKEFLRNIEKIHITESFCMVDNDEIEIYYNNIKDTKAKYVFDDFHNYIEDMTEEEQEILNSLTS